MRDHWRLETQEAFEAPIPEGIFERVKGWSAPLRQSEGVERVAVGTRPLALLIMTNTCFYVVTERGAGFQWCEGLARSTLWGRSEGEALVVTHEPEAAGDGYAGVLPAGSAPRIAQELHKPFSLEDYEREKSSWTSVRDLLW